MAQLVEALRHKPEGRGFDSRWCHWNFSLIHSFRPRYGPGVDSASNRNEYHKYFLGDKGSQCVGLTTLPPSFADYLEIWEPLNLLEPSGPVQACNGIAVHYTLKVHWSLLVLPGVKKKDFSIFPVTVSICLIRYKKQRSFLCTGI